MHPDKSKFVVLGDLNTMGLNAPFNNISDIDSEKEIEFLSKRFNRVDLRRLPKSHELSWWNGSDNYFPGSKLDHVYAEDSMKFKQFNGSSEIKVIGWPEESSKTDKRKWIEKFSDHAILYGEIHE